MNKLIDHLHICIQMTRESNVVRVWSGMPMHIKFSEKPLNCLMNLITDVQNSPD